MRRSEVICQCNVRPSQYSVVSCALACFAACFLLHLPAYLSRAAMACMRTVNLVSMARDLRSQSSCTADCAPI